MTMIDLQYHDAVATIRLNRGVTNALDLPLVDELAGTLRKVQHDADVRGLVLCSANDKFLSIGFDIPQLFGLSRKDFTFFYQSFNRLCMALYTLPKPTVAAITGHAIAGGCILALCCDYRFMAQGRKLMGLNEIHLGVPVPYLADRVLRDLVGVRYARDMMERGEFYSPDALLRMGAVDRVLPLDQVLGAAIEQAGLLGTSPQEAFALVKRNRVEAVEAQVVAHLEEKARCFIARWYSDETRERLKQAMEKF